MINAADYAVGDGITDDTVALNAMLAAAPPGATILFPEGKTFSVTELTVHKPLHFRGPGRLLCADEGPAITIYHGGSGVSFDGLVFGWSNGTASQRGLLATRGIAADLTIQNCAFGV